MIDHTKELVNLLHEAGCLCDSEGLCNEAVEIIADYLEGVFHEK